MERTNYIEQEKYEYNEIDPPLSKVRCQKEIMKKE